MLLNRKLCFEKINMTFIRINTYVSGDRGSTVVKVLCYSGDRGSTVVKVLCYSGTAVTQWLRCCATVGPR